jgi:hypothetical protein
MSKADIFISLKCGHFYFLFTFYENSFDWLGIF